MDTPIDYPSFFTKSKEASRTASKLDHALVQSILNTLADKLISSTASILQANKKDLDRMEPSNPKYDRLLLNEKRIESIASDLRKVATLPSFQGTVLEHKILPNHLDIKKISVPLGVVGIVYEARPNVTLDCFALCIKSGNAVVLKGGSDAEFSNRALVRLIQSVLEAFSVNPGIIQLLPPDRESTTALLQAVGFVDVLIPRGSQKLIDYVRAHSKVPVIETGAGIVHVYFDKYGDLTKGKAIIHNSKTRRVSVCNALDCLIVHTDRLADLHELVAPLVANEVILYADNPSYQALTTHYPQHLLMQATEASFGTEFLDYKMSIKSVQSLQEALDHIFTYSSKHSEVIISENIENIETFLREVDAAAVYANASTAFTDGGQFGMGAEIGISTQKLHARGPMALPELTTYKWVVSGTGQIRPQ